MATPTDEEYEAALKRLGMSDDSDNDNEVAEKPKKKAKKKKPSSTVGGFLDQAKRRHQMLHDM